MGSIEERKSPPGERTGQGSGPDRGRRGGTQHVFDVVDVERLSPQLVRIHLGGDAFDAFVAAADPERLARADKYVKILFAKPELGLEPPYDLDALRRRLSPDDMPVRRTYTVRSVDTQSRTLAIDFVVHGDEGIAGPWAASAVPGDRLCFSGPGGQYAPSTEDVGYLFIGDDSAIPAIAAALEALLPGARGFVLIEVEGEANEVPLATPEGVDLRWIHRRTEDGALSDYGAALVAAVQALAPPTSAVDVFAHGEREAMKELRRILQADWGLDRRSMSLSAYWAKGRSEDRFQAEKREPVGQIFED
jgi:NADPH-dependent ferric siderophore reductase